MLRKVTPWHLEILEEPPICILFLFLVPLIIITFPDCLSQTDICSTLAPVTYINGWWSCLMTRGGLYCRSTTTTLAQGTMGCEGNHGQGCCRLLLGQYKGRCGRLGTYFWNSHENSLLYLFCLTSVKHLVIIIKVSIRSKAVTDARRTTLLNLSLLPFTQLR